MPVEGAIHIDLAVADGSFSHVGIRNRRLLTATRPLVGRVADDVPGLISRLFSICRMAQGLAAAEAVERARGLVPTPAQEAARLFLIAGETVLEHAGRACLDWAQLLGEPPAIAVLKSLRGTLVDLHRLVYPQGDWARPGGGILRIDEEALRQAMASVAAGLGEVVFGTSVPETGAAWVSWSAAGETVAARLAARLLTDGLAGFGAAEVPALPVLDRDRLNIRLENDHTGEFICQPDWDGRLFHTGPLARRADHPLVADIVAGFGPGLLAQIAARVAELSVLLREMQDFGHGLCNDSSSQSMPPAVSGLAVVEAARGRLVHRVEAGGDIVTRYQILAPTEWNFHPRGAFVQGLQGRPAGPDPKARAALLVAALDPCVACQIEGP
ncbi:nickel-dependent hydrogenase large subunit [Telmatospirillum siberiense]|uniref:Ni,Fe-hydrogenase I large subunit n=1 Tax=Telmatospirillum siberiense TaxID=382514 RepID=A0A2N3PRT7_9PROT|nr:nickel-dependent hydrogenase large subunit [Telmatospirillum siberiense]PKU23113.1 Ni,Fe-hydrogenase I large subunit [Telmatospirillum siberiense]